MSVEAVVSGSILLALALGKSAALLGLSRRRDRGTNDRYGLCDFGVPLGLASADVMPIALGAVIVVALCSDDDAFRATSSTGFHLPSIRTSE
ncbi:hypothetical protein [Haladaptatus salinisoli]|uniref:hypothetical protein n=1 Tax=Haladaptatus salinisoli TaxID=2884876 RepID=UPI001D0AA8FD|nr:hypothetical protein [Haladaptatus salinisoli]